jgi:hypothetical protein
VICLMSRPNLAYPVEPVRPFYLIGHNTNSLAEIRAGLERGLNAFELDVNRDERGRLYVSHDAVDEAWPPSGEPPPRLVPFLTELRRLVDSPEGAPIALVIFDCKIAESELAVELLDAVRRELTQAGTSLHVIFSVPSLRRAETFFAPIHGRLTDHEALMIDEEDEPRRVAAFFAEKQVARAAYGNGISTVLGLGLPSPSLFGQMDLAVGLAAVENLRFVYPWVLVAESTIREFVRIGVHGAMVDIDHASTLTRVLDEPEFANQVRVAVRDDDPLAPCTSLLLEVTTADVSHAGTDAAVTFSLTAADGRVLSRTVDGSFNGRFERGTVTYVTMPGLALAPAQIRSITVAHDGAGVAPGWHLASIALKTCGHETKRVVFDCEVTRGSPVTRAW